MRAVAAQVSWWQMDEALEREVAGHLKAGDLSAAATGALQRLGPQILGYLGATLRDDDAAYEVFSSFCEELWKSIGTFRGDSSFKTWAYKIVMHSVGRYRRDGFRRRAEQLGSNQASALAAQIRSTTPPYRRTEVKDRFARLRESLEPDERTLLFLRVDQGLSWTDVAAVVAEEGEPVEVAALRKRFERAKARLRKLAADDGMLDE
jgi:RNA polymerase sigma-70 factor (ECF subfamily)